MVRKNQGSERLENEIGSGFAGEVIMGEVVEIFLIKRCNCAIVLEKSWGDYCLN